MSSEEIQAVSKLISYHPPVIIGTLCVFMYIRGKFIEKSKQSNQLSS